MVDVRCVCPLLQGEVVARAGGLDYEVQSVHYLTIQATDQASPSTLRLSSTALVCTHTCIHVHTCMCGWCLSSEGPPPPLHS